jgi:hypothetical protein
MPNPTLTPTLTALARELAERTLNPKDECYCEFCRPDVKCIYCLAQALLSALASPPVEAAQGEPLPCPFCGGAPVIQETRLDGVMVACRNQCPVQPEVYAHPQASSIAAWNTRVAAPEARR